MTTTLAQNIAALRHHLGLKQAGLAARVGVPQSYVSKWEKQGKVPETGSLEQLAGLAGVSIREFRNEPWAPSEDAQAPQREVTPAEADDIDLVDIQHIDMAYGLGATFADSPVAVDMLKFPTVWVRTITSSPPALLTWTRGRGDSMLPTIDDGDLILLDRSQRRVTEQDALWAFTVGDTASIKRLRVKGDRFQILSDNPAVPPDEEPMDFVNIVARVVFVGRRT